MNGFRNLLGNDRGSFMTNTIIGALLNMLVIIVLGSSVASMAFYHLSTAKRGEQAAALTLTDSTLRDDITWAGRIINDGPSKVTFESAAGDKCRTSVWEIVHTPAGTNLTTAVSLSGFNADGSCETAPASAGEITLEGIAPSSAFSYQNSGGRDLDGPSAAAPEGVQPKAWDSPQLAAVSLDLVAGWDTNRQAEHRITQPALSLYAVPSVPDAATTQVPEGDLRR